MKLAFQEKKPVSWDQIPNYLNLDASNVIKQLERIVNLPARDIEFRISWTTDLPYIITSTPVFSIENLYIASDDKLLTYNKKSRELMWKISLPANIRNMMYSRGVLILILENNQSVAVKDDGKIIWEQDLGYVNPQIGYRHLMELNNDHDPRLDGSVILIAEDKGITVLDSARGQQLSKISFRGKLQYLSDYDRFDNCFYAVVGDEILCIELRIQN